MGKYVDAAAVGGGASEDASVGRDISYVVGLDVVDEAQVARVGGKGAYLAALARIEGVRVPPGFCVTTHAFRRALAQDPRIDALLDGLSELGAGDREAIAQRSAKLRRAVAEVGVPGDVAREVTRALTRLGDRAAYAVRSSATGEDSATASFAGQHDTFLNVVGPEAILQHLRRVWASLFGEHAVAYRLGRGGDHRAVAMAVVVERMVLPDAAGVLSTADPVSSHRGIATVEASFGLGEALVSGRVDPDVFRVRDGEVVARRIAAKPVAVRAAPGGGTREEPVAPPRQGEPALSDEQVVELVALGRRVEAELGCPQDLEWCLDDEGFAVVQSRPITTLFPVPASEDADLHVYVSVGHQQMMTDPMTPLGLSLFRLTAMAPMHEAGGRLFVDVTRALASSASREQLLGVLGRSDPLIGDALRTLTERGDVVPSSADEGADGPPAGGAPSPLEADPAVVAELVERSRASIAALQRCIREKSGPELMEFVLADLEEHKRAVFDPLSMQVVMAAMEATWWLNDRLEAWLGERNAADVLAQSVPGNVASEMGLALLEVADVLRPHGEVVAFLEGLEDEKFLAELPGLPGGQEVRDAIQAYLDTYGMRCVGEIDVSRPRWSERPSTLLPMLLGNVRNFETGTGRRRFEQGAQAAREAEQQLLARVRTLPGGAKKAEETRRMIARVRTFAGYREHPKYSIVSRYFVYKQALLAEAGRLVDAGVLEAIEDVFWLTLPELAEVARRRAVDHDLLRHRKDAFASYESLTPPRVLTSEGEVVSGAYKRNDVPDGALVGLAVSAGTVEGRARVMQNLDRADLQPGDILVTAYTDPSWSPLFVAAAGLVTEVGGLMTHGAVVAREYGLPAVVGVEGATQLITDGRRIRVHGTDGFVELLT